MTIKTLIFDFGGVLLRTEDEIPRKMLAERLGISKSELENLVFASPSSIRAMVGEISAGAHWQEVGRILNVNPHEINDIRTQFFAGDRLDIDLIAYLRRLRQTYKIGLLSNAWDDLRTLLNDHFEILNIFDAAIISAEVGLIKPDLRIYQLAAEKLSIPANQAVFIDDVPENIQAAQKAGMSAIQFQSRSQILAEINQIIGGQ